MKKWISILVFLGVFAQISACPCFDCPDEGKPNFSRVITLKKWAHKNQNTQTLFISIPRLYFNSVTLRFPKGIIDKSKFELQLGHKYYDTTDDWGFAQIRYQNILLSKEDHFQSNEFDQTNLYYAGNNCSRLYLNQLEGELPDSFEVEILLIYVPPFAGKIEKQVSGRGTCNLPPIILQSTWRAGLPPPKPGRTATPTKHCIIHHSADGNGNTNYTDLVRAYYTYHTQVNGWDDIAYNYLIAANGDVYAGRDPEKAGIRQDNVLGAHFCAKNNNTMGVCMIGDFMSTDPSNLAMQSLESLLGWKIHTDTLNPYFSYPHPTLSAALLPVIAGHRDGCITNCPGNLLYAKIDAIRNNVAGCSVSQAKQELKVYSRNGQVRVENAAQGSTLRIYDLKGALIQEILNAYSGIEEIDIPTGKLYIILELIENRQGNSKIFYHSFP